jgi:iron complex transport system substrate-binding protein
MKNKYGYRWLCICLCVILLFISTGCGLLSYSGVKNAMRLVTDAKGNRVEIPVKPQHIVSLNLSTDELLLDLVSPDRIAAVSFLAEDKGVSYVADKGHKIPNKIRGTSAEAIMKLHPDLVLIGDWWNLETLQTLREMHIPVYVYKTPYTLAAVSTSIREVAGVVGEKEQGEKMVAAYERKVEQVRQRCAALPAAGKNKILPVASHGQLGAKGSLYDNMCTCIQVQNVVAQIVGTNTEMVLSKEQIVAAQPDIIITAVWDLPEGNKLSKSREIILHDPAYATLPAIKTGRVVEVPGKCFYCLSQYVADSMVTFANAVYPDAQL